VLLVRLAVAACVLLVLTACGAGRPTDDVRQAVHSTPSPTVAAERSEYLAKDGAVKSLGGDITLSVSVPESFTPTDTAYPRAARAVAFELVIANRSDSVYRPAQMSFVATADGVAADQVIDSTQGYTGVVGARERLLPNQTLRFAVAFGVPRQPCAVRVAVRPDSSAANAIPIFDATV
jgi:hypothetical protein